MREMEKEGYTVELCSDVGYEEIVADVSYENRRFAILNQKKGLDKIEMELDVFSNKFPHNYLLDDFIEVLLHAKKKLLSCKKLPDNPL